MDPKEEIVGGYKSLVPHFKELKSKLLEAFIFTSEELLELEWVVGNS